MFKDKGMLFVILLLFILSPIIPIAESAELPATILWNTTYDSGGLDASMGTTVGLDTNPVVTGWFYDPSNPNVNMRTLKLNSMTGAILWNIIFDSGNEDWGMDVAIGPDGNPVVAGDGADMSDTFFDMRVIKLDSTTGAILWNVTFDSGGRDEGIGVAIGFDGNPVVTGNSCSIPYQNCNIRTLKLDGSTGAILWNVTFDSGGGAMDWSQRVAIGADGNPVVAGSSCNPDDTSCDMRTIKLDGATGAIIWNVTFDSGREDNAFGVAIGDDGNPVISGVSYNSGYTSYDMRTLKLAGTTGAIIWNITFDSGREDEGGSVDIGADGNPVIAGMSCNSDDTFCDMRTIKLDGTTGATIWNVTFDSGGADGGVDVAIGADGNPVVAGLSCDYSDPYGNSCDMRTIKYLLQYETIIGSNVTVNLNGSSSVADGISVTYSTVSTAGNSTLITSITGPTPPEGFSLSNPLIYYDIATSSTVTGPIEVCINYTNWPIPSPESDLRLLHFEGGSWVDTTTSLDTTANIICGTVNSLSPFIIAAPTQQSLSATVEIKPNKWNIHWGTKTGHGKVTALIGNMAGHSVKEIDIASIRLNGTVPVAERGRDHHIHAKVQKHRKGFHGPVLEVKFNKFDAFRSLGPVSVGQTVTVKVTGTLHDGTPFEGSDEVLIVGRD